jgi:hypothetical protein
VLARVAPLVLVPFALAACVDTYCQSGPKYGTQCHTGADLQMQQMQQGRTPPYEPGNWYSSRPMPPPAATPVSSSFYSPGWRPPQPTPSASAASSAVPAASVTPAPSASAPILPP